MEYISKKQYKDFLKTINFNEAIKPNENLKLQKIVESSDDDKMPPLTDSDTSDEETSDDDSDEDSSSESDTDSDTDEDTDDDTDEDQTKENSNNNDSNDESDEESKAKSIKLKPNVHSATERRKGEEN